jgi:hypothetical protein
MTNSDSAPEVGTRFMVGPYVFVVTVVRKYGKAANERTVFALDADEYTPGTRKGEAFFPVRDWNERYADKIVTA